MSKVTVQIDNDNGAIVRTQGEDFALQICSAIKAYLFLYACLDEECALRVLFECAETLLCAAPVLHSEPSKKDTLERNLRNAEAEFLAASRRYNEAKINYRSEPATKGTG